MVVGGDDAEFGIQATAALVVWGLLSKRDEAGTMLAWSHQ